MDVPVGLGVAVSVGVAMGVSVGVEVGVSAGVSVGVAVGVGAGVALSVGTMVDASVGAAVGVLVGVAVGDSSFTVSVAGTVLPSTDAPAYVVSLCRGGVVENTREVFVVVATAVNVAVARVKVPDGKSENVPAA